MNKACSVCGEGFNSPENSLFICEGRGCHVGVHQACYGIVSPPTSGVWYCRKCESQERAARVKCDLCPKKDGAFKRTDTGGWAHVVCALYIPEASFGNNSSMEPIIVSKIPKDRFSKVCCICEDNGSENQATVGACMTCNKLHCRMAFHVTCAQKARLLSEEEDPRDINNVLYVGYCPHHRNKLDKHNYNNLRRPSLSQNLSPAPASPVLSPFPPSKKDNNASSIKASIKTPGKRDRDANEPPPPRRRVKRRKLSSSTESNVSEDFIPAADSVEDTDSVKQPLGLSNEELSVATSSCNNASGSSTTNSRNPSISTIEKDEKDLPMLSPKSVESNTHLMELEEEKTVIETEETISVREESIPPVEQEVVTADCIEEAIVDDSSTIEMIKEKPTASKKPASQRGKRKPTAGISKRDGGTGVPRRRSTVKQRNTSQNKGTKKNSSRQQSQQQTLPPPTSLTELLQRQWEQTAQFVIDQSSRQSNAGTMLSRLYQLQTENQQMQERITNLAAQREFLLATNSQLGSIITESQHQQQHTTNGITEPSYNIHLESSDSITSLPTTTTSTTSSVISSTDFNPTTSHDTYSSSFIIAATTGVTTSGLSVVVQASNADMLGLPTCTTNSTSSVGSRLVISAVESVKPKEQHCIEKKKQRTMKHFKHSSKLHHQQSKGNPVAMPGSVSVIGSTVYPVSKPSEGPTPQSSMLIGNLVPLESSTGLGGSFMANSPVGVPMPRSLPPFSEIAMELNGKPVFPSRDITAVTNTIGGSIPAMSPVVSGHHVVR